MPYERIANRIRGTTMSMLNEVDCSPDTPVIDAAAERMALKEMEHEEFRDTNEMSGFQRGYSRGFLEGAEFIRSFYRKRDMRDHLIHIERERKKREDERKKEAVDDRLLQPAEPWSPDASLRPVNHSHVPDDLTPPMGGFHD